nr:hypothetical protein [Cherry green ring mottle virus]
MKSLRRTLMELSSSTHRERESQRSHRRRRTLGPPTLKIRIPKRVTLTYYEPEERESLSILPIPPLALAEALSTQFRRRIQLRSILPLMTQLRQSHPTGLNFSRLSRKRSLTASLMLSCSVTITVLATKQRWSEKLGMGPALRTLPAQLGATVLFVAFVQSMLQ